MTTVAAALCDGTGRPRLVVAAHPFQAQLTEERLQALGLALRGLVRSAQPAMLGVTTAPEPRRRCGGAVRPSVTAGARRAPAASRLSSP
ncbi:MULTISPECIES: hypothetical protein [Methylobacterium]|uniref:hypothetical protein n=1 Tax=Methylobacterium TaxID=407 RepID=UPI0008F197B2|nr:MULTISPECIES: hypothetical protein [Methylobacterium]MBZ6413946.1 hypothetical protein [Methylobacterium sp.]MBK3400893.1 hypothetical protein [Methylobacterium ajmalii]MBK3410691.1 hypothetical protein [Methylobacterium ajmalii]MBK3423123.1 hypothetical protein [Methylobacterium ajmalii]SFF57617.1 hypothetical protein SAMN04487844_12847 [Methylobacterium sp. yr596]